MVVQTTHAVQISYESQVNNIPLCFILHHGDIVFAILVKKNYKLTDTSSIAGVILTFDLFVF